MNNKKVVIGVIFGVLVIVGLVIFLINKDGNTNYHENDDKAKEVLNNNDNETKKDSKVLVVYFSMAGEVYRVGNVDIGNTAIMASYIKEYLNADSFEIVPVKPYTTVYNDLIKVAREEQSNNARPEIKNKLDNIDLYDTIFIGYPIWWGDMPPIVYTFLEQYNFNEKTIIPFNTHEGSGDAGTYHTLANKMINSKVNLKGLALNGKLARTEEGKTKTINWLKELGY